MFFLHQPILRISFARRRTRSEAQRPHISLVSLLFRISVRAFIGVRCENVAMHESVYLGYYIRNILSQRIARARACARPRQNSNREIGKPRFLPRRNCRCCCFFLSFFFFIPLFIYLFPFFPFYFILFIFKKAKLEDTPLERS